MSDTSEREALWSAVEASPEDRLNLSALADWFEDHDDSEAAACLRWVQAEGKVPFRYFSDSPIRYHYEKWEEGWYWWAKASDVTLWKIPPSCGILARLWKRLDHNFDYNPVTFKQYASLRQAYEALIEGWRRVPKRWKPNRAPAPAAEQGVRKPRRPRAAPRVESASE